VLSALKKADRTFSGLLYAGLMVTETGPRVVEFNCRFGDPETETLLPLLASSLLEPIDRIARGESIEGHTLAWHPGFAATTVLAASGYPDTPRKGDAIRLPAPPTGLHVFHAATKRDDDTGELRTNGGRVLAITATAATIGEAAKNSRDYAERVSFDGKQFRRDIAWRDLERDAGAA
jgi:phosphoribosylamine--glycine ligase